MDDLVSPENALWLARGVAVLHALVAAITVAGCVGLFTGRFRQYRPGDLFAWAFMACCLGQLLSLTLTGGCILTHWQRGLLSRSGEPTPFSETFLQHYLPWLPDWFAHRGVPLLTLGALAGASIQVAASIRRRRMAGDAPESESVRDGASELALHPTDEAG